MKKPIFLIIVLFAYIGTISAQSIDTDAVWKLTEMNEGSEVYKTTMHVIFNKAGEIEISGANVGTWSLNRDENTFTISCPYLGVFEGESKIEKLDDTELVLSNANGDINSLKIISLPKNKQLNNKITGEWILESMEKNGEKTFVGQFAEFNKNGIFFMEGSVFGTWDYNALSEKIIFDNEEFFGEHPILKSNEKELVLNMNGDIMYFSKIDKEKIKNDNKESGLMGLWEFKDVPYPEAKTLIIFKEPDEFTVIQKEAGMTANLGGIWIFHKNEMTLLMLGLRGGDLFDGESKVVNIEENELELENNGMVYRAQRKVQNGTKIEHLAFSEDEFYTEDGDYKYYGDEEKLPWRNWNELKTGLLNINQLVYNYSTLISGTDAFETKTLTADVEATIEEEEEGFNIDNIFNGYDRLSLPEDSEFPQNTNFSKPLYPLEDDIFRIVGNEQIVTPAGTFDCTVLEAVNISGWRKKMWMINDKIGVYAKIIEEDADENFGHYSVYELQEIK